MPDLQAIVLLSGGLDSVYNLYAAHQKWPGRVEALTIDYGQRAYSSEVQAAQHFSSELDIPLLKLDLKSLFSGDTSSLTSEQEVPTQEVDIESVEASKKSAEKVWVSNRNGVFLNVAACVAEKKSAPFIIPGFNLEEAETFPDNSVEYIEKMNACLKMSTANAVQIFCFSQDLNKKQIVAKSRELSIDLNKIWSCYFDADQVCGKCESCQRFERARGE